MIDGADGGIYSGLPGQQDFYDSVIALMNFRQQLVAGHAGHDLIANHEPDAMPVLDEFLVNVQRLIRALRVFKFAEFFEMILYLHGKLIQNGLIIIHAQCEIFLQHSPPPNNSHYDLMRKALPLRSASLCCKFATHCQMKNGGA